MGLPHATAMVVGTIIGASIFVQPAEITGQVPSISGVFFVWLVAGALTLCGALVCAELASTFARSGGVYLYLTEAFSPALGFLWAWAMFLSIHSGIIAAVAMVFARYLAYFVTLGEVTSRAVAVVLILVLSAVNYVGVRPAAALQTLFTVVKLSAIVLMVGLGFLLGSRLPHHFQALDTGASVSPSQFGLAVAAGLFAFGGWHMVTYNAEETLRPRRTIPWALVVGTLGVTVVYMSLNAVYLYLLPLEEVASSHRIAADAADRILGGGGGGLMAGLVLVSTCGALIGIVLAGPRVYYALAREGRFVPWLGHVHPRFCTPDRAIVLQALCSAVLVCTGTYRVLFSRVIYTEWLFFALMTLGLFRLRRRRDLQRRFSVWGYPIVPALFIVTSLILVLNQLVSSPGHSAVGLLLVLLGWPAYHLWGRENRQVRESEKREEVSPP